LTAGIGKTMFGYYLLWRWACRGERVVFRKYQYEDEEPFLLCSEGVFRLDKVQWQREAQNPATR
jgi:hypothetical protein